MEMVNRLKTVLKSGGTAYGAFMSLPGPAFIEAAGIAGLDFVVIDTEHTPADMQTVETMIRTAESYGMNAVVRMEGPNFKKAGRWLDIGAHGLKMPHVDNAEMAREFVRSCKFTPEGDRGISAGRGSRWGKYDQFLKVSNDNVLCVVMCESAEAVENIDEITRVPGVDVVFIGTGDLAASMGHIGDIHHPEVEAAIQKIRDSCIRNGVVPGIVNGNAEDARKWRAAGFRYITVFQDLVFFTSKVTSRVEAVRAVLKQN